MIKDLIPEGDMLDNAFLVGLITEGEYLLLDNIAANYKVYEHNLEKALKSGLIGDDDERGLRDIRKRIYTNALRTAYKGDAYSKEEGAILEKLRSSLGLDIATLAAIELDVRGELKKGSATII